MNSNRFSTDSQELYVEVELDHVFIGEEYLGLGDVMSHRETIRSLRDSLTELLDRVEGVVVSQR